MKFKKLVVLMLALAALIAIGLVKKVRDARVEKALVKSDEKVLDSVVTSEFINRIEIKTGESSGNPGSLILLGKGADGEWRLESHYGVRAQKIQVDQLLKVLSEQKGEVRAESEDVLGDFQLRDQEAFSVKLIGPSSKEMAHVFISPLRSGRNLNFVRLAGKHRVIAASPDVLSQLEIYQKEDKLNYKLFADLKLAKFDVNQTTRIEVSGSAPFTLAKKQENGKPAAWAFEPPTEQADTTKVSTFLSGIANLYARDVVDPKGEYGFGGKAARLRVTHLKDGKPAEFTLILGNADNVKKTVFVQTLPDALVFELADSQADTLSKDRSFFLPSKTDKR